MSAPTDFNAGTVLTGRKRWAALAFLALGVSMIILDATIVNVAIPTMVQDLGPDDQRRRVGQRGVLAHLRVAAHPIGADRRPLRPQAAVHARRHRVRRRERARRRVRLRQHPHRSPARSRASAAR